MEDNLAVAFVMDSLANGDKQLALELANGNSKKYEAGGIVFMVFVPSHALTRSLQEKSLSFC